MKCKGSNAGIDLAPSTGVEPRLFEAEIFNVIWELKCKGYSERTLHGYSKRLRMLAKHVQACIREIVFACIPKSLYQVRLHRLT
jgi:hypothetical protein